MVFHKISTMILGLLFYKVPKFEYTVDEIREYDRILNNVNSGESIIDYDSNIFPKYKFIQYISETRNVLLHGSNNKSIQRFEPRKQTLFNGNSAEAVFASNDGIWPVFYAVLDKKQVVYNIRNGSLSIKTKIRKFHFYSLDRLTTIKNPWTSGNPMKHLKKRVIR